MINLLPSRFRSFVSCSFQFVNETWEKIQEVSCSAFKTFSNWIEQSKSQLSHYRVVQLPSQLKKVADCLHRCRILNKTQDDEIAKLKRLDKEREWIEILTTKKLQNRREINLNNPMISGDSSFCNLFDLETSKNDKIEAQVKINWHAVNESDQIVECHLWVIKLSDQVPRTRQVSFQKEVFQKEVLNVYEAQLTPLTGFDSYSGGSSTQKVNSFYNPISFYEFNSVAANSLRYNLIAKGADASYIIELQKGTQIQRHFIVEAVDEHLLGSVENYSMIELINQIKSKKCFESICNEINKNLGVRATTGIGTL